MNLQIPMPDESDENYDVSGLLDDVDLDNDAISHQHTCEPSVSSLPLPPEKPATILMANRLPQGTRRFLSSRFRGRGMSSAVAVDHILPLMEQAPPKTSNDIPVPSPILRFMPRTERFFPADHEELQALVGAEVCLLRTAILAGYMWITKVTQCRHLARVEASRTVVHCRAFRQERARQCGSADTSP